jgi:hypothetical protein
MNSFFRSYFRLLGIGLLVVAFSMPVVRSFADADPGVGVPVGCGTCDLGCKDGKPVWVAGYRNWFYPFNWVPGYWNCGGACHSTGNPCAGCGCTPQVVAGAPIGTDPTDCLCE